MPNRSRHPKSRLQITRPFSESCPKGTERHADASTAGCLILRLWQPSRYNVRNDRSALRPRNVARKRSTHPARPSARETTLQPLRPSDLDVLDHQLIDFLREDGRRPTRDLALQLGVSEASVRSRLRRLQETRTVRVVAVRDIFTTGNDLLLRLGVEVADRPAADVARELADYPAVLSVILVSGRHQIEVLIAVGSREALQELLEDWWRRVRGIRRLESALTLEVCKFESDWATDP